MFDSGQRLSLNFCQGAWLCHFLADGVRAGRGGMKGGEKGSSEPVRALCYKQDDLARLVFIANKHAKYKQSTSICTCHAYKNTHPHEHIQTQQERWDVQTMCPNKVRNKRCACRFRVNDLTFTITTATERSFSVCFVCVCVCACMRACDCMRACQCVCGAFQ